jgi:hypothetical protein
MTERVEHCVRRKLEQQLGTNHTAVRETFSFDFRENRGLTKPLFFFAHNANERSETQKIGVGSTSFCNVFFKHKQLCISVNHQKCSLPLSSSSTQFLCTADSVIGVLMVPLPLQSVKEEHRAEIGATLAKINASQDAEENGVLNPSVIGVPTVPPPLQFVKEEHKVEIGAMLTEISASQDVEENGVAPLRNLHHLTLPVLSKVDHVAKAGQQQVGHTMSRIHAVVKKVQTMMLALIPWNATSTVVAAILVTLLTLVISHTTMFEAIISLLSSVQLETIRALPTKELPLLRQGRLLKQL